MVAEFDSGKFMNESLGKSFWGLFQHPVSGMSADTQSDSRPDTYGAPKVIRLVG